MKILVIGGTGLISTAITRQLLARGDQVTLYNRGTTPARFPEGASYLHGDRNDFAAFEAQIADAGSFDCVIDMICFNQEQAQSDIRALRGRTGHFIFCSTVNVYTKPADAYPIVEDARREPIDDDYGVRKVQCEDAFMEAHRRGDFPVTVIRPAATYGEGGVVIHTFGWKTTYLDRIRKGKPIVVHGDGTSLWVMCHVDDCAHSFVHAAGNAAAFGKAYHVTGEEWLTWNRYHELVAQALDAPAPRLVHIPTDLLGKIAPERAGITVNNFYGNTIFDNTAAKTDLDFRYTIDWKTGVRRTVAWLDANGRILNSDDDPFDDRVLDAWARLSRQMQTDLIDLETNL
ncbi:MAG: NAD-dependent epimerase/dehydratase family protein [Chloroflexota bacterium]|nr:NAD-dependent epimerase/dehydratase family protein [Chloroflexota bacterium]